MLLDLAIGLLLVGAVSAGLRLGFTLRLASWVGLALGALVGVIVSPEMAALVQSAQDSLKLLVGGATVGFCAILGQSVGWAVGRNLSVAVPERWRGLDRGLGAALGVVGVVLLVWFSVPMLGTAQGALARVTRQSAVARWVHDELPAPPEAFTRLQGELDAGRLPQVFDRLLPAPPVPDPPADVPIDVGVQRRLAQSVVKLVSDSCGRRLSGSGFVVGEGLIATNAHVVAAAREVVISGANGRTVGTGRVVGFDPRRDLAFVATRAPLGPVLPVAAPSEGDTGAVLGFPGGGEYEPSPMVVAAEQSARGRDIYRSSLVTRQVLVLSAELIQGDSGSAVVRADGVVIGVAFAIAPDQRNVAYALSSSELEAAARLVSTTPVETGPCT